MYCCRTTSPSTSTTSGTLTTCTPSSTADWFRRTKSQKGQAVSVSHSREPDVTPIKIRKKFNTIWTNLESRCTKIRGEYIKIQCTGAIWSSIKEKECSSIKLDRTQSLFFNTSVLFYTASFYNSSLKNTLLQDAAESRPNNAIFVLQNILFLTV